MKRRDLVRQILALGCVFVREGGSHSQYKNPRTGENIPVPRHAELDERLSKKILKDAAAKTKP